MALTRKMLKAMGLEDEKIDQIIEAHTETVDGLKESLEKAQAAAKALPGVQKELVEAKGTFFSSQEGVEIESRLSFTGFYLFSDDMLLAEKGQAQSYHLEFTMSLT